MQKERERSKFRSPAGVAEAAMNPVARVGCAFGVSRLAGSREGHQTTTVNSVRKSSYKNFLGHTVCRSTLGPRFLVWLGVGLLSYAFPALAQQSLDVQLSETETPASQQLPDLQLTGSISGTVMDGSGAVVVGARVTLTRADQSPSQEVLSGEYGQFAFAKALPGPFQITITAAGFAAQTSSGVLHSGETYFVPANRLAPATLSTEVQVGVPPVEVAEEQVRAQEKQRVLGMIPNFYVSYDPNAVPLTSKLKFQLAWKTMIDPVTFALTAIGAGVQQAQNDFSGYGQGAQGYAKRFGASYADDITSTFIGSALLPSLLKQDPRYFYKGTGSTKSRILYAIANAVICKGDNQRWQPNYSAILGGLASGGISNLYYPPKDRGAGLVFENTLMGTGTTAILNVFQEFVVKKFTPHLPKYDPSHP
jgi:Carboxypeptidase regulatory-like domain